MSAPPSPYSSLKRFIELFSLGLPALLYHKIDHVKAGVRRRGLYLSPRIFKRQILELRRAGFTAGKASEAARMTFPNQVVITFDDGFQNVWRHALPVLADSRFCAINFIVAGRSGGLNTWDLPEGERPEPLMDASQIRDWIGAGQEIGAHTCTHPRLTQLSRAQAREEIGASKKALEDQFGRAITDFAYPFGDYDDAVRGLVEECGFDRAWTTNPGVFTNESDRFALPRISAAVSLRNPLNLLRSLPW